MLGFEGEKKPTALLEKQLHKHGVGSYLHTEVENLANNNNDSLNVTVYKYLNLFMGMCICLWVCVTRKEHFPKLKLGNDEVSLGPECSYVQAASRKLVSRESQNTCCMHSPRPFYTV